VHDLGDGRGAGARALFQSCVPWNGASFWWHFNPILTATWQGIDTYYAAMLTARVIARRARLPLSLAYALAVPLMGYFTLRPQAAATVVYRLWCSPDVTELQAVFAPLRWASSVRLMHTLLGSDIMREEREIAGGRVVLLQRKSCAHVWESGSSSSRPERPTILFIPGGAFISDFEAADLAFLYRWVRETDALVVYVSYNFAPQSPYPAPMLRVFQTYRALREHRHDLPFVASPLVVSGLSAGGNLALSALLAPMLQHRAPAEVAEQFAVPPLMPAAILLLCPTLNLSRSPSPSRICFASDVLLPLPFLKAFASAYDQCTDHVIDPLLSPVFAADEVLRRLPPTHLQCGGLDPLLDDSVDFNTRIRRVGVPGELTIFRSLPHTYVSFPHWHAMPEVEAAMAHSCKLLRDCCAGVTRGVS